MMLVWNEDGSLSTEDGDRLLCSSAISGRYGVSIERPSRWRAEYGPGHRYPYPGNVPGQHIVIATGRNTTTFVRASALDAWVAQVHGKTRPSAPGRRAAA